MTSRTSLEEASKKERMYFRSLREEKSGRPASPNRDPAVKHCFHCAQGRNTRNSTLMSADVNHRARLVLYVILFLYCAAEVFELRARFQSVRPVSGTDR